MTLVRHTNASCRRSKSVMTPTFFPCYATPVEQGPKGKHLCLVQDVYIGGIFIIVSMLVSVADDVG